ncbi:MAG: cytochrome c biogenesis protein CcdA [Chloroflexota bacterium]
MPVWFIPLAFGLGLIGAFTPCAFAINALLLGYLRERPRLQRIMSALRFASARALFLSLVGLLFALAVDQIGLATTRYQQAINVLLILLGVIFILDHYHPLPLPHLDLTTWLTQRRGVSLGFGLLFGLDIPACASPLFFAVLSRTALNGDVPGGILALLAFGLGMSAPAVMATSSDRFNAAVATLARQRRGTFIWAGGITLILAGLIELLPQTMTPFMTATDQIARRTVGLSAFWVTAGVLVPVALIILVWLRRWWRRPPDQVGTVEEKSH